MATKKPTAEAKPNDAKTGVDEPPQFTTEQLAARHALPQFHAFHPPFEFLNVALMSVDSATLGLRITDIEAKAILDSIRENMKQQDAARVAQSSEIMAFSFSLHEASLQAFNFRKGIIERFPKFVFSYACVVLMADQFHAQLQRENLTSTEALENVERFGAAMFLYAIARGDMARDVTGLEVSNIEKTSLDVFRKEIERGKRSEEANDTRLATGRSNRDSCVNEWKSLVEQAKNDGGKKPNKSQFSRKVASKYSVLESTIRLTWLKGL